jgi:hypothetical protein
MINDNHIFNHIINIYILGYISDTNSVDFKNPIFKTLND